MSPHTPKWAPTLRVGVLSDFRIFRVISGDTIHWFEKFLTIGNFLKHKSKMGSPNPFEYLQHKLWPKERLGAKVSI
jgi:hypothetical protein